MIRIIQSECSEKLLKHAAACRKGGVACCIVSYDAVLVSEAEAIGLDILSLPQVPAVERERMIDEYIYCIGDLCMDNSSVQWWAHPVSEKNEHSPEMFGLLTLYHAICSLFESKEGVGRVVYLCCPTPVCLQLKARYARAAMDFTALDNGGRAIIEKISRKATTLLRWSAILAAMSAKSAYARFKLLSQLRRVRNDFTGCYVVRTWFDRRFVDNPSPETDAYFGGLPGYLASKYPVVVVGGVLAAFRQVIERIKRCNPLASIVFLPEEVFFRSRDIVKVVALAISARDIGIRPVHFMGHDVTLLVESQIRSGFQSTLFLLNLVRYCTAGRFARQLGMVAYIQPFENYAWEKAMLLGIRKARPGIPLFGFQHAFISRSSFKYFLTPGEHTKAPLPDAIITLGEVTRRILLKHGGHSPERVRAGCALRQTYLGSAGMISRSRSRRILVPLTMVAAESVATLQFLYEAGLGDSPFTVVIRNHPAASWELIQRQLRFRLPQNFVLSTQSNVQDDLAQTGVLLYTWTTVAVEAIVKGIPAIHLDILYPMMVDPLFECGDLKRTVTSSRQLMTSIEELLGLDDETYAASLSAALKYLNDYFFPPDEAHLKAFLPAA